MLCADLVVGEWSEASGKLRSVVVNLENISSAGACIQSECPVPLGAEMTIKFRRRQVSAVVRYCVFREIGYFIGLEFEQGFQWSPEWFRPQHLLDPRRL
jgi:hypothetical protein